MDPRYGRPPIPRFPLFQAPRCTAPSSSKCSKGKACVRKHSSENRYYYTCECGKWSTWDDAEGVHHGNRLCHCGFYCRKTTRKDGTQFETCAIGICKISAPKTQSPGHSSPAKASLGTVSGPSSPSSSRTTDRYAYPRSPPKPSAAVDDTEFVRLLDHVMAAAERAIFPSRVMDMSSMGRALHEVVGTGLAHSALGPFKIRSTTEFERHSKVGAAGELYVFKLLEVVLGKDEVHRDHWTSNMRDLVRQHHPDFRHWPKWAQAETADIVFQDTSSALTDLLIDNGYLDRSQWFDKTPVYLIEVKSSLSNRNNEFYLSSHQYVRMQENSSPSASSAAAPKIYMIARVSNLQDCDPDMRLYVDPERLRQEGKLKFRQVWAVEDVDSV